MAETLSADVAVVGGGPAGLAAAIAASAAGASTVLVDEGSRIGGQVWRHRDRASLPRTARELLERFDASAARHLSGASVVDARPGELVLVQGGDVIRLSARRIVIATGARELLLPFPGWTLPNVFGVGGLQALIKAGLDVRGRRIVIAGTGPLLLPVAATAVRHGAHVVLVAEQASRGALARFGLALLASPSGGKLVDAVRYRLAFRQAAFHTGTWIARAEGTDRVRQVTLASGRRTWHEPCDLVATACGLIPNGELGALLGCARAGAAIVVNERQETSVPGVFAAGECTGVGGEDLALVEGAVAGLVAGGRKPGRALMAGRRQLRRLAAAMTRAFAPRRELLARCEPGTIICRCEDVRCDALRGEWGSRQARLVTRAGMGACQGRVCGAALHALLGWDLPVVRPPVSPMSAAAYAELNAES
ncbi:MAG TPA: FAD-dependent oxidoreductase [Gemmatimonadaceae bacterium]|nr:FAD-dependent oxidoreductase [Gemmatimonadaceae bacterium]